MKTQNYFLLILGFILLNGTVSALEEPDLMITDISWEPEDLTPDYKGSIYFSVGIKNTGDIPVTDFVTTLTTNGNFRYATWNSPIYLNPGEQRNMLIAAYKIGANEIIQVGNNTLKAKVDYYNSIEESNETNNERTEILTLAPKPQCRLESWPEIFLNEGSFDAYGVISKYSFNDHPERDIEYLAGIINAVKNYTGKDINFEEIKKFDVDFNVNSNTKNTLVINGPAVNRVTAYLMGLSYPTYGTTTGIPVKSAMLKTVEKNGYCYLISMGWDTENIKVASQILANWQKYKEHLVGTEVCIYGTQETGLTFTDCTNNSNPCNLPGTSLDTQSECEAAGCDWLTNTHGCGNTEPWPINECGYKLQDYKCSIKGYPHSWKYTGAVSECYNCDCNWCCCPSFEDNKKPDIIITDISCNLTTLPIDDNLFIYITAKNIGSAKTQSDFFIETSCANNPQIKSGTRVGNTFNRLLNPGESIITKVSILPCSDGSEQEIIVVADCSTHDVIYDNLIDELNETNNYKKIKLSCSVDNDQTTKCGDGICNGNETFETCPQDCGYEINPYDADVAQCTASGGNVYPTTGNNSASWFVWNGCARKKYYQVTSGENLTLHIHTDSCSSCVCTHPNFYLYEYENGQWVQKKYFDLPDKKGLYQDIYYTANSDKIKIYSPQCFYLDIYSKNPVNDTNLICTDSDNGKNYYVKGYVKDINGEVSWDICTTPNVGGYEETTDYIFEKYCDSNGHSHGEQYHCPNGCKDGACIQNNSNPCNLPGTSLDTQSECEAAGCDWLTNTHGCGNTEPWPINECGYKLQDYKCSIKGYPYSWKYTGAVSECYNCDCNWCCCPSFEDNNQTTKCGDGICNGNETEKNCLQDCAKDIWIKHDNYQYTLNKKVLNFTKHADYTNTNCYQKEHVYFNVSFDTGLGILIGNDTFRTKLDLESDNYVMLPVNKKIKYIYALAGGNTGNVYLGTRRYVYKTNIYLTIKYSDGTESQLSTILPWDWTYGRDYMSKSAGTIYLKQNPCDSKCAMYVLKYINPYPDKLITAIIFKDDFTANYPRTNIVAITLMNSEGEGNQTTKCGDGICNGNENSKTCPEDCSCSHENQLWNAGQICCKGLTTTHLSKSSGYCVKCGDNICKEELGENEYNCPEDCIKEKVCENSCPYQDKCINFGIRVKENGTEKYCSLDETLEKQKEMDQICQNNYECLSNACVNGKCMDVEKQLNFLTQLWCKIINLFDDKGYANCIQESID